MHGDSMTIPERIRCLNHPDGTVVLDLEEGTVTTLNSTGSYIWKGISSGEARSVIAENLARETGTELSVVQEDVFSFLSMLRERGWISATEEL